MTTCPVDHQTSHLGSVTSTEARSCPIPFFKRLQAEAPVYKDPVTGAYVLTRYDDIAFVAEHPDTFHNHNEIMMGRARSPVADEVHRRFRERGFPEVHTLSTADPPHHTRYRRLVDKVFTPNFVKSLEPVVYQVTDELIDTFAARGSADLFPDFASLLPIYMIADQLGVSRADWRRIRRWSDAAVERADPALPAERELELTDEMIDMQTYLYGYVQKFREAPNGRLLSNLTQVEHEGERLTDGELMSIGHQMLVGGNETTATALLSVLDELLNRPELLARVKADTSLIPLVVEETLRLHTPAPTFYRTVMHDIEIGGVAISEGSTVALCYMGGNYDPRKFENPDIFDIDRKGVRQHLTFGRGLHFCIGHLLAKTELRVAVERLLARLPNLRFSSKHPKPTYATHAFVHTLDTMRVEFDVM